MAPLPDLSNEQKLTYIYHMLKDQESRHKRAMWYKFFRWLIIIGAITLLALYPGQIMGKIFEFVKPLVIEQTQSIMEENKNNLMKILKNMLPETIESSPSKPKTMTPMTPASQVMPSSKTRTGATNQPKKAVPI